MLQHDELYHYGKKGMKWGIRSAVRNVATKTRVNLDKKLGEQKKLAKAIKEGRARKRADRRAKIIAQLTNTPYKPDKNQYKHHMNTYEKTASLVATAALTSAAAYAGKKAMEKYIG